MIKISSIFVLGLLVALTPYSGFPIEWKNFFYIVFGLAIVIFSILIRRELHEVLRQLHNDSEIKNDTFSQNSPEIKNSRKEEK
jgi:hypothetical protein